jgi:SAM-dependent methyltransferase
MTAAMADAARHAALEAGLEGRVEVHEGMYEALPIASASVDVVISNGVVNLAPDKRIVFREIARVLRPGGRLHLADVVVQRELTLTAREDPDLWSACIGGALEEHELAELAREAGLAEPEVQRRYLSFAGTSAGTKVSADLHVSAVNFFARKPE